MADVTGVIHNNADSMDLWFLKIFNAINELQAKARQKEGFIITSHVYSEQELLDEDGPFKRINELVTNIESTFTSWLENKAVSDERRKEFWTNRLLVERRLGETRAIIIERQPTIWERIRKTFEWFMNMVMTHLPMLPEFIMKRIGLSFSGHQKVISRVINIDPDKI